MNMEQGVYGVRSYRVDITDMHTRYVLWDIMI